MELVGCGHERESAPERQLAAPLVVGWHELQGAREMLDRLGVGQPVDRLLGGACRVVERLSQIAGRAGFA